MMGGRRRRRRRRRKVLRASFPLSEAEMKAVRALELVFERILGHVVVKAKPNQCHADTKVVSAPLYKYRGEEA